MKYLSLFSGVGGFEKGINQAYESLCNANGGENGGGKKDSEGAEGQGLFTTPGKNSSAPEGSASPNASNLIDKRPLCIGYSEVNEFAIRIYQKNFPTHKNYGDVTQIKTETIPRFDLLVGGFPCQSFSVAGKRGGFEDTRGTLFFEIARILADKKPSYFLLENVKGLLSHGRGQTFRTIISTLANLGYDMQWQVINSKNFGVPQNRERIFIVGHLRGGARPEIFPILQTSGTHIQSVNNARHDYDRIYRSDGIAPTLNTGQRGNAQPKILQYSDGDRNGIDTGPENNTDRVRKASRLPGRLDEMSDTQRYKCTGNAVTVNVVQAIMEKFLIHIFNEYQ